MRENLTTYFLPAALLLSSHYIPQSYRADLVSPNSVFTQLQFSLYFSLLQPTHLHVQVNFNKLTNLLCDS